MSDRTRALVPARVTDERRRELAERLGSVHVSRIHEMPRIELYLDQLLTLVAQELEFMRLPDETLVTGSMVNNYVKQGVIPAPHRKRYTRRHVASLLFVCALKRVFSIAQVRQLAALIWTSELDLEALYDRSCEALERSLAARFSPGAPAEPTVLELVDTSGRAADPELAWLLQAAIDALAARVVVEQTLLLGEGEAR
ncbi:DUF1836 domain-containing protein [Thermophilibacter mediterraneus]|uniref:DUF1836 domain-containing protein n=1 Tax=Thermophilibacter mediterraneus TaxID=1871031 RepID=UPI002356FD22|nr:DUF1836 domain-containing protein [Thermophilibacter mediterraneus]